MDNSLVFIASSLDALWITHECDKNGSML